MHAELTREWDLALVDAAVDAARVRLYYGTAPGPAGRAAAWLAPGVPIGACEFAGTPEELHQANGADLQLHRVVVYSFAAVADQRARLHLAAQLRHEIEHALQHDGYGSTDPFEVTKRVHGVLRWRLGFDYAVVNNMAPLERDAHRAAAGYLTCRFKGPLLEDPANRWLVRDVEPVAPYEDAVVATTAFAYLVAPNERDGICAASPEAKQLWELLAQLAAGAPGVSLAPTIVEQVRRSVATLVADAPWRLQCAHKHAAKARELGHQSDGFDEAIRVLKLALERGAALTIAIGRLGGPS